MPPRRTVKPESFLNELAPSLESVAPSIAPAREGGDPRLLVGKRLQRHRLHVRQALLPEPRVAHVLDLVVRVEAEHPVGAGPDRASAGVDLVVEPGGHDRRVAAPRQEAEHPRVPRLEPQPGDVLRDDVDTVERRNLTEGRDAAGKRRGEHLLDRVLDVPGVELLAVVEPDALAKIEGDRPLVGRDPPRLGEGGLEVQVPVPLDEGVVRGLLAPVVRGEDRAERRDMHRILLQREGHPPAAPWRLGDPPLRGCGRSAGDRAGGHRPSGDDPCLDERVPTGQPSVGRALRGFLVGHSVDPPLMGADHRICPTRGASPVMSS